MCIIAFHTTTAGESSKNMYSSMLNSTQMSILEAAFANNRFLNESTLTKLAQDTGLDKQRILHAWLMNRIHVGLARIERALTINEKRGSKLY